MQGNMLFHTKERSVIEFMCFSTYICDDICIYMYFCLPSACPSLSWIHMDMYIFTTIMVV